MLLLLLEEVPGTGRVVASRSPNFLFELSSFWIDVKFPNKEITFGGIEVWDLEAGGEGSVADLITDGEFGGDRIGGFWWRSGYRLLIRWMRWSREYW